MLAYPQLLKLRKRDLRLTVHSRDINVDLPLVAKTEKTGPKTNCTQ